jgi:hypothetical protein
MAFTGNENHDIDLATAKTMIQDFRSNLPLNGVHGGFFGKAKLLDILNQTNCVGIRYYYAHTENGDPTIVLVGADANEDDLAYGELAEFSKPCPPRCGVNTIMNA